MKIAKIIVVLTIFTYTSCKKTEINEEHTSFSKMTSDTLIINDENFIITFKWNTHEIDDYKANFKNEDDFYTIMDDVNYYTAEAQKCFQNFGVQELIIDKKKYNYIKISNTDFIKIDTLKFFDQILILKNKKAKIIKPVDLLLECKNLSTNSFDLKESELKSFDQFTPKNYSILTKLEYDWTGDKIQDMLIVYDSVPSNKWEGLGKRPLIGLRGKKDNLYEFWFRNDDAVPCRSCSGNADPDFELKIENGKLQYQDVSLLSSTAKSIRYTFDQNLYLETIDLNIEELGDKEKKSHIDQNKFPKVNLRNIDIKKFEREFLVDF